MCVFVSVCVCLSVCVRVSVCVSVCALILNIYTLVGEFHPLIRYPPVGEGAETEQVHELKMYLDRFVYIL